jgi:sugar diacid utilization regulator
MNDSESVSDLRTQMSNLCSVFALSMMLFDRINDDEILQLVVNAVPALGPCRAEGTYLVRDELRRSTDHDAALRDELGTLAGAEARVTVPGAAWAWAYPLRAVGGHCGYLVVTAEVQPSADEQFLISTLAQQAGAALNSAGLYQGERVASAELRERNEQLASVNQELSVAVADLERQTRLHEALTHVVATGGAEQGIAAALHELTGMAAVVEDRFGNLLGEAGGAQAVVKVGSSARDRTELLTRIRRTGRPVRHRDRIVAVAQPRDEVLGVLALVDSERQAGPFEWLALEDASVVLAMELAHQRSLAEIELRLRGDLVDDLLTGTDDESALARSPVLGHDLRPAHQVVVVSWPSGNSLDKIARATEQAAARITQTPALVSRHAGKVVLIAPARDGERVAYDWAELHRLLAGALPSSGGSIGVGRLCAAPSELPRSYAEALRALGVQQMSDGVGVMTFEGLGFYRMLGDPESHRQLAEYIREWLGPLLDYDAAHHYDLVATLGQYYESGGNYDTTARKLLIHRSTLRYRLRRIRELTGYDLGAVDTRLNLHIATRAWQILRGPS